MTRKKFLATSAMMVLTVLGVAGMFKKITELPQEDVTQKPGNFGSNKYGV